MIVCKRCLYTDIHPLKIVFDDSGICSGCRVHEEKDTIFWPERFEKLRKITDSYRSRSGENYDCIIPVSGARDSYFVTHVVKNILNLNPLLVHYNKHYNTRLGIRNLAYLRIATNCDLISKVVSPNTIRAVNRATLQSRASMYWHCIAGQTNLPIKTAVEYKIPLIIWGAHQGIDQVGMFSHLDEVEMTRKYRKEHDLMGLEVEDLLNSHPELENYNLECFRYPQDTEIAAIGIRGIYLNNYLRWDSKAQHELMIDTYGYETAQQTRTFDTYNDVDCFHYSGLHDYIKFLKHGYGKATDHACREIRLKRISRAQGIALVNNYGPTTPADLQLFLDWMEMCEEELWSYVRPHCPPATRSLIEKNNRTKKQTDISEIKEIKKRQLNKTSGCEFPICNNREPNKPDEQYVTVGKGFVEGKGPNHPIIDRRMPESSGLEKND